MDDKQRRLNMIENQLRPNEVTDLRVLEAMANVPREPFVPAQLRGIAYADEDIVFDNGRFLVEPRVVGRLLMLLETGPEDTALVIGCETGYSAALMSHLAATVFAVVPAANADEVEKRLDSLGAANCFVVPGDNPLAGHLEAAPYDAMLAIGSIEEVPAALTEQLSLGGRLAAVIGTPRLGRGTLFTRLRSGIGREPLFDAASPAMRAPRREPDFVF